MQETNERELTPREIGFVKRMVGKYDKEGSPLLKSILIFSALIGVAHAIEQSRLPGWVAFLLVYIPGIWLFSRYRRFAIFKSRVMRKLALRAQILPSSPPASDSFHPEKGTPLERPSAG